MLVLVLLACYGNIENQFATSVMQEHIVPSAVNASIASMVDQKKLLCQSVQNLLKVSLQSMEKRRPTRTVICKRT